MQSTNTAQGATSRATLILSFWLSAFVLMTLVWTLRSLPAPLVGPHAGVSAHFCVMADAFARDGVLARGGVPVQNNPPYGRRMDVSTHWPPLFTILLSGVFRLGGSTEATARAFMLLIFFGNALLLMLLLRKGDGIHAALWAALSLLAQPIMLTFGLLVIHLHLAILLLLAACLCFLKAGEEKRPRLFAALGVVCAYVSVWTSWEPVLAYFSLWLGGLLLRNRAAARLGFLYFAAALLAILSVFLLYFLQYPDRFAELVHVVAFRFGLQKKYLPELAGTQPTLIAVLFRYWKYLLLLETISLLSLAALVSYGVFHRRRLAENRFAVVIAGLVGFWLLWFLLLRGHAYFHEYQLLLAQPILAVSAGVVLAFLSRKLREWSGETAFVRAAALVLFGVVPLLMSRELVVHTVVKLRVPEKPDWLIVHAESIGRATPANAVVLSPYGNIVLTYYANRHHIRDVKNDEILDRTLAKAGDLFHPGAPVYLALTEDKLGDFPRALASYPVVLRDPDLILLELTAGP